MGRGCFAAIFYPAHHLNHIKSKFRQKKIVNPSNKTLSIHEELKKNRKFAADKNKIHGYAESDKDRKNTGVKIGI